MDRTRRNNRDADPPCVNLTTLRRRQSGPRSCPLRLFEWQALNDTGGIQVKTMCMVLNKHHSDVPMRAVNITRSSKETTRSGSGPMATAAPSSSRMRPWLVYHHHLLGALGRPGNAGEDTRTIINTPLYVPCMWSGFGPRGFRYGYYANGIVPGAIGGSHAIGHFHTTEPSDSTLDPS